MATGDTMYLVAALWRMALGIPIHRLVTDITTVKYSAFLRKQTRYNPTRGGT